MTIYLDLTDEELADLERCGKLTISGPLNPTRILGAEPLITYAANVNMYRGELTLWLSVKQSEKHK